MKRVLLVLLAVVLILGVLGAAGFAGYQYGYRQGALSVSNGDSTSVVPGFWLSPKGMRLHDFGFDRDFGRGDFGMIRRGGIGFGFFAPLLFLVQIAFWALVIWAVYMLVKRSGWRLTRNQTAPVVETVPLESNAESKNSDAAQD